MHPERYWLKALLFLCIALTCVLPSAAQDVSVAAPAAFHANSPLIAGWHWCRAAEHLLDWEWNAVAAPSVNMAALNFALLVTNRASGGSGYGAIVNIVVYDVDGEVIESGVMHLVNPFLPQVATDTGGIGYRAYGAYQFQKPDLILHGFKVRITWPPACPETYHFAGNEESASLAYVL